VGRRGEEKKGREEGKAGLLVRLNVRAKVRIDILHLLTGKKKEKRGKEREGEKQEGDLWNHLAAVRVPGPNTVFPEREKRGREEKTGGGSPRVSSQIQDSERPSRLPLVTCWGGRRKRKKGEKRKRDGGETTPARARPGGDAALAAGPFSAARGGGRRRDKGKRNGGEMGEKGGKGGVSQELRPC